MSRMQEHPPATPDQRLGWGDGPWGGNWTDGGGEVGSKQAIDHQSCLYGDAILGLLSWGGFGVFVLFSGFYGEHGMNMAQDWVWYWVQIFAGGL